VFGGAPLAGPLGYANANAAFYVQAAVAALLLAVTPELRFRVPWILTASVFALVPILNGSRAALLSLAFLVPGSVVVQRSGGVRAAAVFCGATWLLVLCATFVLGHSYDANGAPGLAHRLAAQGLSERRLALWHDALSIARQHPITGAGPGSFALESPVATADPDAAFAHNEYLEQAAETGIPALLLLMCLFAWGLVRLSVARGPNRSKALALAGWSAMGVHASVDYILHFAVIPMVAVALIGSTMASRSSPKSLD
jgi:O-antigen ligase